MTISNEFMMKSMLDYYYFVMERQPSIQDNIFRTYLWVASLVISLDILLLKELTGQISKAPVFFFVVPCARGGGRERRRRAFLHSEEERARSTILAPSTSASLSEQTCMHARTDTPRPSHMMHDLLTHLQARARATQRRPTATTLVLGGN